MLTQHPCSWMSHGQRAHHCPDVRHKACLCQMCDGTRRLALDTTHNMQPLLCMAWSGCCTVSSLSSSCMSQCAPVLQLQYPHGRLRWRERDMTHLGASCMHLSRCVPEAGCSWPVEKRRLYEFIVRAFLAACSKPAVGFETAVELAIAEETFTTTGADPQPASFPTQRHHLRLVSCVRRSLLLLRDEPAGASFGKSMRHKAAGSLACCCLHACTHACKHACKGSGKGWKVNWQAHMLHRAQG